MLESVETSAPTNANTLRGAARPRVRPKRVASVARDGLTNEKLKVVSLYVGIPVPK